MYRPKPPLTGRPDFVRPLFLNAAATVLTVLAVAQVQQGNVDVTQAGAGAKLVALVAGAYVAAVLISFVAMQIEAQIFPHTGLTPALGLCALWSVLNVVLALYNLYRAFTASFGGFRFPHG